MRHGTRQAVTRVTRHARTHVWAGVVALCLAVIGAAQPACAQTVRGVVLDAETGLPVPAVALTLRDAAGIAVARADSDEDGRFNLVSPQSGLHTLEAERLGYAPVEPQEMELYRDLLEVELRISSSPIAVDPITVTGRRLDPRHDLSLEGMRLRHESLPRVGPQRVILRTDPEFVATQRVSDVLRWFPSRSSCTILFSNGHLTGSQLMADSVFINSPTEFWQAVEFYRRWHDAPMGLREVPPYVDDPTHCSVIALWSRDDPVDTDRPFWQRALILSVFTAAMYAVGTLFMDLVF